MPHNPVFKRQYELFIKFIIAQSKTDIWRTDPDSDPNSFKNVECNGTYCIIPKIIEPILIRLQNAFADDSNPFSLFNAFKESKKDIEQILSSIEDNDYYPAKYQGYKYLWGTLDYALTVMVEPLGPEYSLYKPAGHFVPLYSDEEIDPKSTSAQSGLMTLARKRFKEKTKIQNSSRNDSVWFIKSISAELRWIEYELIAGEIYRFLLGNIQSKSRPIHFVYPPEQYHLAVKGVPNFRTFRSFRDLDYSVFLQACKDNTWQTLAGVLIASMWCY